MNWMLICGIVVGAVIGCVVLWKLLIWAVNDAIDRGLNRRGTYERYTSNGRRRNNGTLN